MPPPRKHPPPHSPPPSPIGRWVFAAGIILIVIGSAIWIKSLVVDGQASLTTIMGIIFEATIAAIYAFVQIHQHLFPNSFAGSSSSLFARLSSNTKLVKWVDYGIPVIAAIGIIVALTLPYPSNTWATMIASAGPSCDGVNNTVWKIADGLQAAANYRCLSDESLEIAPKPAATIAELDLEQVNGGSYSQTRFDVAIQVTFEDSQPDANLLAGLVVQTPQHGTGGYILAMNNTGYWELVDNNANRRASHGLTTTATTFTVEVKVEQDYLYCLINGQQVYRYKDTLNSSSTVSGLIVYGYKPPLPAVTFSNFSLSF